MNLYVILGVEPGASAADIKRAYRRLSRKYHPGVNPGDRTAEETFARIAAAYEVLIDPRRRQAYDSGTTAPPSVPGTSPDVPQFTEFDFSVRAFGAQASTFGELFAEVLNPVPAQSSGRAETGADLHATLAVPFAAQLTGDARQIIVTRQVPCGSCRGAGRIDMTEGRCTRCEGLGQTRWARGHMVFSKSCATCGGTGRQRSDVCAACVGQGRAVRTEAISVRVPAGVRDGTRLRLPEQGHAGVRGGKAGDLYVTIQVLPHPLFRRDGDDLACTVPVAVHEAVLGARVEVPALDGVARISLPPGTQGGRRFRVSGRGFPTAAGAGDLVVEVRIVLPPSIDERSQELIREFGRRNPSDVRRDLTLTHTP
jgi:molecular chaperone DnaJ